jgi:hypothetical protein
MGKDVEANTQHQIVTLDKGTVMVEIQKRWNGVNGQGLLSASEERDAAMKAQAIGEFLVGLGVLSNEDLSVLSKGNWS